MTFDTVVETPVPQKSGSPAHGLLMGSHAVLIPVKGFAEAKGRLGLALSATDRVALVRSMAAHVVSAAAPLPVAVVCDDTEVANWARELGALVIWEPGRGLNGAVEEGVRRLSVIGVERVTVAHSDLPLATSLGSIEYFDGVTLVPDRRDDGTNVIVVGTDLGFCFSYGPGSFERHRNECDRLGLAYQVQRIPDLSFDVDEPSDLSWQ